MGLMNVTKHLMSPWQGNLGLQSDGYKLANIIMILLMINV